MTQFENKILKGIGKKVYASTGKKNKVVDSKIRQRKIQGKKLSRVNI